MTQQGDQDVPDAIGEAAQDWFLRLSSGTPTDADRTAFAAWRDADPRHAAAYDEVQALWDEIEPLRPAFATTDRPAAMPRLARKRPAWRRRSAIGAGLLAASLLLFAANSPRLTAFVAADHRTGIGQQTTVTLPDGSVAYLNTDTAIDIAYSAERREVRLRHGEALFEVRKDAGRPFDVVALEGRTTAVGTAFAVRELESTATVTVTEGTVRVASPEGAVASPGVLVDAGHQVSYRQGSSPGSVRNADAGASTAWRQGVIAIRDRPLAEALAEIGRYRPGRILLLADTTRMQPVTARLAIADLDAGIDALASTQGLSVTRLTEYLVILR